MAHPVHPSRREEREEKKGGVQGSDQILVTFTKYKSFAFCKSGGYIFLDNPKNTVGLYSAKNGTLLEELSFPLEGEFLVDAIEFQGSFYLAFSSGTIVRVKIGDYT